MTDEELIRTYRRAETKGVAVILAAKAERTDVDTICRRLMAAGVAGNIRPTLRRVLRTHDLKNIPQQAIEEYLRKYGKSLKPKEPQKGCVDRYCEDCRYLDYYYGYKTCAYFTTTGIRRGCPAGEGCEKRELKKRRKSNEIRVYLTQGKHIIRCQRCGKQYYDSLIRECPKEPGRKYCMYCCGSCSEAFRDGSGWGCRGFERGDARREGA